MISWNFGKSPLKNFFFSFPWSSYVKNLILKPLLGVNKAYLAFKKRSQQKILSVDETLLLFFFFKVAILTCSEVLCFRRQFIHHELPRLGVQWTGQTYLWMSALGRKSHHKLLSVQFCLLSLGFWFRVLLKLEKITVFNAPAFPNPPQKIRTCLKMFPHVQSQGVK